MTTAETMDLDDAAPINGGSPAKQQHENPLGGDSQRAPSPLKRLDKGKGKAASAGNSGILVAGADSLPWYAMIQ